MGLISGSLVKPIDLQYMKTHFSHLLLFFVAVVVSISSCDRPACKNNNPVFDRFAVGSREYKAELIRQLKAQPAGKTRYWIDNYIEANGRVYIGMYVQGPGLCAKGILDITDTVAGGVRIKRYKEVKGGGFSGAELDGLKYSIDSAGGDYNFVLSDLEHIID